MSQINVDNIKNRTGGAIGAPAGAVVTGIVTATGGSFSGNVSVGGVLTYEDVTNIDSVGVVTARTGIKVLAGGINAVGVVTATSFSGSGANLTGIDAAPSFTGIASGSLSNGQTVIITSDGKVTGITQTNLAIPVQRGEASQFEAGDTLGASMRGVYDPDTGRVVVAYIDNDDGDDGQACAGLVDASGTITFGSPVKWNAADTENIGIAYDTANDRIVVCGRNNANGNAVYNIGSLSGSTITFGSVANLSTDGCREVKVSYDTNADRVLFIYKVNTGDAGKCRAGEVDGLTVTNMGSEATFESSAIIANQSSVTYHAAAQKHVITYAMSSGGSYDGRAKVATIDPSDNSVTFGTHGTFHSATNVTDTNSVYDPDNARVVITFQADNVVNAIVGQVTGTNITFGPKLVAYSTQAYNLNSTYDTTNDKVILMCANNSNNRGQMLVGNVNTSDNSISIASTTQIASYSTANIGGTYDPVNDSIVFFFSSGGGGGGNKGSSLSYRSFTATTNVTTGNFLGFSNAAYTNGQSAKIQVVGSIDDAQTGLTTGAKHYIQNNGTLGITTANPVVEAGLALSDTKILIR